MSKKQVLPHHGGNHIFLPLQHLPKMRLLPHLDKDISALTAPAVNY